MPLPAGLVRKALSMLFEVPVIEVASDIEAIFANIGSVSDPVHHRICWAR